MHRRTLVLDWRGHGESGPPKGDFGFGGLVSDALAVTGTSGAQRVIPVGLSHSGWVAIELRRRLGNRIRKLVLVDWIVLEPPQPFLEALRGIQAPDGWRQAVEQIFSLWFQGTDHPGLVRFVREEMGSYGFDMWARAAREIGAAYAKAGSPLGALSRLKPPVPVVHLYAQPPDPGYMVAQQKFASSHPPVHRAQVGGTQPLPHVRGARSNGNGCGAIRPIVRSMGGQGEKGDPGSRAGVRPSKT